MIPQKYILDFDTNTNSLNYDDDEEKESKSNKRTSRSRDIIWSWIQLFGIQIQIQIQIQTNTKWSSTQAKSSSSASANCLGPALVERNKPRQIHRQIQILTHIQTNHNSYSLKKSKIPTKMTIQIWIIFWQNLHIVIITIK